MATYRYTTLYAPGAVSTTADSINLLGEVDGYYNQSHNGILLNTGFTESGGTFSPVAPPGAISTTVNGINLTGDAVGNYNTNDTAYGFIDHHGAYVTLAAPFGVATQALGINAFGAVVGEASNSTGFGEGFVYQNGTYSPVSVPGAYFTYAHAINDWGQVAGLAGLNGGGEAYFLESEGNYTLIKPPDGNIAVTGQANGAINDLGQVVGTYSRPYQLGFLYDNGTYTDIAAPGAMTTVAINLNDRSQVVGYYGTSNGEHGFLYDKGTFTNIDVPGASMTVPLAINDLAQIAGYFLDANGGTHGFVASPGGEPIPADGSQLSNALSSLGTSAATGIVKAIEQQAGSLVLFG